MSNFDYEGFPEGEWDDRGELAWNEFDWERHLKEQDSVYSRYQKLYERFRDHPERLDKVAQQMGWDVSDWTSSEYFQDEDEDFSDADEDPDEEFDPYTLHKHPIFIATKSLYFFLQQRWLQLASAGQIFASPAIAARYQASLYTGEADATAAIHALDMADYALAVCLFKRALSHLNASFHFLDRIARTNTGAIHHYRREATTRLFDLREVWLRVMQYSREEIDRRIGDDE